ncbi:MerR family transcriptional regulator [Laceyella putida]|uniref:MerR family transcriptional regulator n=1 Tax=Laceyella putida TaxID=110101 RepID=A0ABW2RHP3_9BACL
MAIGEVSTLTGVSSSAIRHWENERLISLPRDQVNGYRKFNRTQIRQIQMIRILRSALERTNWNSKRICSSQFPHIRGNKGGISVGVDSLAVPNKFTLYVNRSDPRGTPAGQGFELVNHRSRFACHRFRTLSQHFPFHAHASGKTDFSA